MFLHFPLTANEVLIRNCICLKSFLILEYAAIWAMTWYFQQYGMCNHQRLRSACAYPQSDQSLCWSLEYSTTIKLLTEHHFEYLILKGSCTGLPESTLVKMPHWLHRLVLVYICQNATLLEITCRGSIMYVVELDEKILNRAFSSIHT